MPEQFEFLILNAPERLRHGQGLFGVRLDSGRPERASEAECVIVAAAGQKPTAELLRLARTQSRRVLLEVSTADEAAMAGDLGFDGVVSKTPLAAPVPMWGTGGIGLHSAAAWYAGGAVGVVLDVEDRSWTALAQRFRTLPAILRGLRDAIREHVESAKKHPRLEPLAKAAPDTRIIEGLDDASIEALLVDRPPSVTFSNIHDGSSAAMAAVLAAPLAEKGARLGIFADADIADEGAHLIGELVVPFAGPRVETAPPLKPFDVAIVGMGCLLPKAPNVRAFWANILNKVDAIGDIPKERFNIDLYYDPDRKAKDKIHSRWGGFLDAVPFDPMRYGIPPNALPSIDPLQLLALVTVDQALRDAGYHDRDFPRQTTSVILGLSGGLGDVGLQYAVRSMLQQFIVKPPAELLQELPEWTEDSFAGLLLNVAAGRVANRFDLGGVNFSVDAACASSLAAVYLAARELADHSSDMAIVGGVDTAQSPFGYLCFAKAQALSSRGRCRTFDESADGIAISEGISMMVLKRLEDAERDGDRIYAVIKGVAGSSDGKGKSMTAPRLEGQILALQRAYARAGIRPSTVGLIEAHGTGTILGDASELAAVADVFLADGAAPQSCAIGSVKSMVGHTKSAAGITGLMKVALALYHKTLPPTLHVEKPNPKLLEPGTPIFVNTETLPWIPPAATPRRGGVSAFGFGGTNFHAVLEEFQGDLGDPADVAQIDKWPADLYVWNDPTPRGAGTPACRDGSKPSQTRLAIVATSPEDLQAKLAKAKAAQESKQPLNDPQGIYLAFGPPRGKVAFLFPGQGSQKPHMLRELALHFPEFRASLEQAEQSLAGRFPKKLSAYIYPPPAFTSEQEKQQNLELTDTVIAQPALGVVEIGLCHALERLGVRADMTAGHSYGEYVALAAAGVISDSALFELSESRGRAIKDTTHDEAGTMAAVSADAEAIVKALDGMEGITLANHNSPRQTVISGANAAVGAAIQKLEAVGLAARPIPVACAFHSPLMEPARERFAEVLARQIFAKPHAAVFSNTLGGQYPEDPQEIAALLASHLVRPVKFVDEIRAMYEQGARVFVEVGPKGVLTGLARQILEGKDARFVQIDSDRNGLVQFLHALAQLAVEGVPVDTAQLIRGRVPQPEPEARETGWMVNGLKAFPRNQPPRVVKPLDLVTPSSIPQHPQPAPVTIPAPAPVPSSTPSSTASDAVMLQFQQLMKQVLQTQTTIMTAYLQGAPTVLVPVPVTPPPPPVAVAPPPPPPAIAAPPAPAQRSFVEDLRRIAAERTGYPPEMLDLDAGIESDLGIDSIKRVEILTALQKLGTPEQQQHVQGILDKLTGARTLREIADLIGGVAVSASAPAQRSFIEDLRRIAAERTGYPPEMLDLDAGIESDLGIDSIKRVEILTALQKLGTPEQQQHAQGIMNKLTSARTLREIAELITAVSEPRPSGSRVAPAGHDYLTELVKIASERTGYEPDMLNLDAGIESDLGIDSIKRVEILTALQQRATPAEQAQIQAAMEKLTSARTLREIANLIASFAAPTPATQVPRFILTTTDQPRSQSKPQYYPGRVCLITDDETGIASGLADDLKRNGERAILLRHSPDATISAGDVFTTDLADPAQVESLIGTIRQQVAPIGAIIHLLPLRAGQPALQSSLAEWRDLVRLDVRSLYALARAAENDLKQTGRAAGALFAAITARGGAFGLQPNGPLSPTHFAVADFTKTLALEFTGVLCKVVDLDATDPNPILRQKLIDELTSPDETLEVGLPGDRRLTVVPQIAPLAGDATRQIQRDWVFLVTGGARGVTAEIARQLAERYQPTLILAGASALPSGLEPADTAGVTEIPRLKSVLTACLRASSTSVKPAAVEAALQRLLKDREIVQNIESLRRTGAKVEYHSVDVRHEEAFGELIDRIYTEHGRLDVVIHGAGIIEDKLIRDKTPESFDRVVHTKADSAFLLSRKLRPESLQCLLLMSSVTAAFGNRGQADYAAANGIMNGLAAMLSAKWPARVVAMNWGPWAQSGMVSEDVRQQFLARGIQTIPLDAGAQAALREIEAGTQSDPVVALGEGPWREVALPAGTPRVQVDALGSLK
jgi:acyl transferase domain-containing protein/NAD(P)-dependent dehydrogenase (short-subunit alcohol dehydrogenase family)/acyl carrier protein